MKRARERYGVEADRLMLADIRRRIEAQTWLPDEGCVQLSKGSPARWALWYKGEWVAVVYDETMGAVVTFLPPEHLRRYRQKLPW